METSSVQYNYVKDGFISSTIQNLSGCFLPASDRSMVGFEYRFSSSSFRCLPHQEKLQVLVFLVLFPPKKKPLSFDSLSLFGFFSRFITACALPFASLGTEHGRKRKREREKYPHLPHFYLFPLPAPTYPCFSFLSAHPCPTFNNITTLKEGSSASPPCFCQNRNSPIRTKELVHVAR